MRETYVRPTIYFESFSLSQSIARNCGDTHQSTLGESNHYNPLSCAWDAGGVEIFFDITTSGCADWKDFPGFPYADLVEDEIDIDDVLPEGLCYNNPEGGQTIFSSI